MNISSAVLFLPLCAALFAGAGSARAAEGRIAFSGAVVEPTCAADIGRMSTAEASPAGAIYGCAASSAAADVRATSRIYRLTVVEAGELRQDRLIGYFAKYTGAEPRLVTQAYE
ncbi:MAG: hypothetical protein ACTHNM_12195 [Dyella sp.]|uniref:hypothetical protein n=1 Tax=Dyella sp. TaxID=1869338 RepID=UPI003F81FC40